MPGFTRIPIVEPGARRPTRSSWESRSTLRCTPVASNRSRSRSDTFVPVKLISSGAHPCASAHSVSPGEQTSIPTNGADLADEPQEVGVALRLQREADTEGQPRRAQGIAQAIGLLAGRLEVVHEHRRAVLVRDRLRVAARDRQAPVAYVQACPRPPGALRRLHPASVAALARVVPGARSAPATLRRSEGRGRRCR